MMSVHFVYGQHSLRDVDWLKGQWKRTNSKPGRSGSEIWSQSSDSILVGKGVMLKGADTVFIEKIKIILRKDVLYYVADVEENAAPVAFKFTSLKPMAFVCENPLHDFPKQISYALEGDKLKAVISGNGKSIEYWFERVKE
jgi:hypothetical protein